MKAREFFKDCSAHWKLPSRGLLFRSGPERGICLVISAHARASANEIRDSLGVIEWDLEYINCNGGLFETRSNWIEGFEVIGIEE